MEIAKRKKLLISFILVFLIALQLARIVYVFAYEREGYHSDENWSYGFANSYYNPHIYQDVNGNTTNFNTWTSSQVFRDYLEVNKGEEFSYGSIYTNQKNDFSPPLHTMILHTICSFFPETFSWWYSFWINIVAFVLAMVLLYFLGKSMTKSRFAGLVICMFYGFTTGALNTFVYLRMYAILTMFAILSAWLHSRIYNKNFKEIRKEIIFLIAVTAAGILTHYYFLVFSFFMAACFCIYLFVVKRWRTLFAYAGVMLLSVGLAVCAYPFMLSRLINSLNYLQMPYVWRLKYCIYIFLNELTGITFFPYMPQFLILCYAVLLLIAFALPVCFLFRKETWFLNTVHAVKKFPGYLILKIKSMNWFILFLFISIAATLAFVAGISNVLGMGIMTDRYLFFLMPLFAAILVSCFYFIIKVITKIKVVSIKHQLILSRSLLSLLFVIVLITNNYFTKSNYLFERSTENATIEEITKEANCILVMDKAWRLTYYASRLVKTDKFFTMLTSECMNHGDELQSIESSNPMYLILETNLFPDENGELKGYEYFGNSFTFGLPYTEKEFISYLTGLDWIDQVEYLSTENCFAGIVSVYRISLQLEKPLNK